MPFSALIGLINTITSVSLGTFVFLKSPSRATHRAYFFFGLSVGLYSLGYFLWGLASSDAAAIFAFKVLTSGIIIINSCYLEFVFSLLERRSEKRKLLSAIHICNALFVFAVWTEILFSSVGKTVWGYWPKPYFLFYVYFLLWLWQFGIGLFSLRQGYLSTSGMRSTQIRYVFISTLIGYFGGGTNWLPWFGITFPPYLNALVTVYVGILAYAIIRHQLLDIEVIIKKTLVFAGLFAVFMVVVGGVTAISQGFLSQYARIGLIANGLISALIAVALYDPTRRLLVNLTDNYLFQKKFSLTSIVAQASEAIALVQSLKWLSRRIVAFLVTKCRIKSALVYVHSHGDEYFERGAARGYSRADVIPDKLTISHAVIQQLRDTRRFIEINRIDESLRKKGLDEEQRKKLEEVRDFLKSVRAEAVIPSFLRRRLDTVGIGKEKERGETEEVSLRNILVLGGKKSDETYSDEDLNVFYSMAQESAIAIENARLYDEVVERTRLLEQMNTDLSEANERLKVTQASLIVAEKNATMVGMAKAIGHEVNNPLSTVAGRAVWIYKDELRKCRDVIARNSDSFQEPITRELEKRFHNIEDNAKRIEKSAKRIEVVVKTLTDILKDTKGEKGPLSLLVLCREAREATRFLTYDENLSGCHIVENIASNIVILGNLEQLLQVFINLIKNSYEAMIGQQERRIEIKGNIDPDNDKMARIEFIDNGPGIPEEVLPKIWGQGFSTKIKKEETIGAAGQGQGLFICKHVIESIHNGEIYAESAPGKGTIFVVKVPLADLEG